MAEIELILQRIDHLSDRIEHSEAEMRKEMHSGFAIVNEKLSSLEKHQEEHSKAIQEFNLSIALLKERDKQSTKWSDWGKFFAGSAGTIVVTLIIAYLTTGGGM